MKKENSGKLYIIKLDFGIGQVCAELLDFSDLYDFDGILVHVHNMVDEPIDLNNIHEIKLADIVFGPVPINKYPSVNGKYAWKYLGKSEDYITESPWFKHLRGLIIKDDNWSNLSPWFKVKAFDKKFEEIKSDYNEIRRLETTVLHHQEMVKIKVTMFYLINRGDFVGDFYDLTDIGKKNMFIQLINTYFNEEKTIILLKEMYQKMLN